MSIWSRTRRAFKAFGYQGPSWYGYPYMYDWETWGLRTPTDEDFAEALHHAHRSSLVTGCVEFIISNAVTTPWTLLQGEDEPVEEHPLLDLLDMPNPQMDGTALLSGVIWSLSLTGNAYVHLVRNRMGDIAELHYLPHHCVEVRGDRRGVTHYVYRIEGMEQRIELDDMLHMRRYMDWQYPWFGRAPIAALGPEIWLDMEAKRMVAAVMRNRGMPGGMISPKDDDVITADADDLETTRRYMRDQFSGDKRGNWLVLGRAMDVHPFTYDPRMLDMRAAYHVAEERVAQAFGIPAAVVGFDAGLANTRVGSTQEQFERQAWQGGIIPIQDIIASQISRKLVMEDGLRLDFDRSSVTVLQEDEQRKAEIWTKLVAGGIATIAEARLPFGLEPQSSDEVFLRPVNIVEVPQGQMQAEVEAEQREAMADAMPEPQDERPPGVEDMGA